jgi:MbtH protein
MSSHGEADDERIYSVVVNSEDQYSIWFADRELPNGWRAAGMTGKKRECLEHIEKIWTDMRPKSLRTWMDARGANGAG